MRVLHIGKFYHPYRGGIEIALKAMCDGHTDKAEVQVLVANNHFRTVRDQVDGVAIIRVGNLSTFISTPICPSFPLWLRRISADLIVLHEPNPLAVLSCLLVRPDAQIIVWFHSDVVRYRVFYPFYRPLLERCLRRARRIVVTSPNQLKYIPLLSRFHSKCVVIPFGIDPARFALVPSIRERVIEFREKANASIILFVGRLTYYKGVEYLIDAMQHVPAKLVVVGDGQLRQSLRARARRKGLEGRVEFAGEVAEADLVAYYHACEVFVLPSVEPSEAFGLVQLEAMACSKPVVSTNLRSGVPWVNQHGQTGIIVEPKDSRTLADAINLLTHNESLRSRYGENGRRRVEAEFTIERMQERVLCLYQEVMNDAQ